MVYGRYFRLSKRAVEARIDPLLKFAQLSDRGDAMVRQLSGGMQRRLVIARSLLASPELVVLDEPTTGLDPQARHLIWKRLRALKKEGLTMLLTSHYMEEAAHLCDRLMVLNHGRVLDMDSPRNLISKHVEPEVVEIHSVDHKRLDVKDFAALAARLESVGDMIYAYAEDASGMQDALCGRDDLIVLRRPANLEDVFLKLTGRELREG